MKSNTTSSQPDAKAMVTEAWEAVGASFEHFCLTAGVASLARMLEEDAAVLCGDRHERSDTRAGYRWGRTKGKIGFHGGRIEVERPRVRRRSGVEVSLPSWETALAEDWLGIQISANFWGGAQGSVRPIRTRPRPNSRA